MELLARQMVEGFITGLHKSPYHGFSVEFAEHRLYNTGESTRHIDWKVYARTDRLYTKRFEEETNLRCHINSLSIGLKDFQDVINNSSYYHNYLHSRSIYRINRQKHIDSGYQIFKEDPQLVSPIGVLYYETYDSINNLQSKLEPFRDKIQCVVSQKGWFNQSIYFGKTQTPELWDYADHVDTIKFLVNLN